MCNINISSIENWIEHSKSELHENNINNIQRKAELKEKNIKIPKNTKNNKSIIKNKKLFSAYDDVEEEDDIYNQLNDEKKQLIKENIKKIITDTFEDKQKNKKNIRDSIPKGFFDDPTEDSKLHIELKEEQKKKNEKFDEKLLINADTVKNEISSESDNDEILNNEVMAMIECAEFLGNLTKMNKKKKYHQILREEEIKIEPENYLNKKRKIFEIDFDDQDSNDSLNFENFINTDFRNTK